MRGLAGALIVVAVLAAAACSDSDKPSTGKAAASPGAASTSAAASPTVSTRPQLTKPDRQRKARAALIAPNGLVPMGGPAAPKTDNDTTDARHLYCGRYISFAGLRAFSYRYWAGEGLLVEQHVEGFMADPAVSIIAQVKQAVTDCTAPYQAHNRTYQVVGPVDLGTVGGTDAAYGVCVKFTESNDTTFWCHAYLARDNFLTYLAVISGPTLATSTKALKQVVLLAAGPLDAGVKA